MSLCHLSDHDAITLQITTNLARPEKTRISLRPITDAGLLNLYNRMELEAWDFVSDGEIDIESKFEKNVYTILVSISRENNRLIVLLVFNVFYLSIVVLYYVFYMYVLVKKLRFTGVKTI